MDPKKVVRYSGMVAPELQADNSSSKLSKIVLHSLGSLQRRSVEESSHWTIVAWGAGSRLVTAKHEKRSNTFASARCRHWSWPKVI